MGAKIGEKLCTQLGYSRLEEPCLHGNEEAPDGFNRVAVDYASKHDQRGENL